MMNMRKILGFTLLLISCIAFGVLPIIPFLPYETEQLAVWAGAVFIFAEVTWWLAIPLLGREIIDFCKGFIKRLKDSLLASLDNKDTDSK